MLVCATRVRVLLGVCQLATCNRCVTSLGVCWSAQPQPSVSQDAVLSKQGCAA